MADFVDLRFALPKAEKLPSRRCEVTGPIGQEEDSVVYLGNKSTTSTVSVLSRKVTEISKILCLVFVIVCMCNLIRDMKFKESTSL